ncbi:MAG: integrase [Dinoroseobacter sp.]|nr:integrase [Dinoroseobacter sp.]
MKKPDLPYVEIKKTKGRTYFYFVQKKKYTRLPNNPDSKEFMEEYWKIRSGKKRLEVKTSWDNLITQYYRTSNYQALARGTKANYRRHCEEIREKNGSTDVRLFKRRHALAARDTLHETWSKANERLAILSILCNLAVDLEWIDRNPVTGISKLKGGSYEAWSSSKLDAYERHCDVHGLTTARTIYELCVGTGQRIGDCIKMTWEDFDGEFMQVIQEKTGTTIWIYCPIRLQRHLATLPRSGRHILARNLIHPLSKRAAQKAVEEVREAIGVMRGPSRLVSHGWR